MGFKSFFCENGAGTMWKNTKDWTKGHITGRKDGFLGREANAINSGGQFFHETLGNAESQGTPGVLGIIQETALNVWNTIDPKSERSVFHRGAGIWSNPFDKNYILNPFNFVRRATIGAIETTLNLTGNTVGLVSSRAGNLIKKGVKNAVMGVVDLGLNDTRYLSDIASKDKRTQPYTPWIEGTANSTA